MVFLGNFTRSVLFSLVGFVLLQGCTRGFDDRWHPIFLYQIDIQQGNVILQSMLDKLKPGMNQEQVRFIMGNPVLIDPFHSDRWEYIYSYQKGAGIRKQMHITFHFQAGTLAYISGDVQPGAAASGEADQNPAVPEKATE